MSNIKPNELDQLIQGSKAGDLFVIGSTSDYSSRGKDFLKETLEALKHEPLEPILIQENGPWSVRDSNGKVIVESDDFTHDVTLSITGDFDSREMRLAYANEVAKALNAYKFSGADEQSSQEPD